MRSIGVLGLVAAVLLGACDSGTPRTTGSGSRSGVLTAASTAPVAGVAGACRTQDAQAQRSATMPVPRRATKPIQLISSVSPELFPPADGAEPTVTARSAWETAHLPTAGGGHAAIVFGTYPPGVPGAAPEFAWLVYATDVAITNGYRTGYPILPFSGIKGRCAFGYLVVAIDATTGRVLSSGVGVYP